MAERTYTINAPIDQVRSIVTGLFTQEGWTVAPFSADTLQITRGKKGMSIAFGALMGSSFYLSQNLQFGTGPHGETLVRYVSPRPYPPTAPPVLRRPGATCCAAPSPDPTSAPSTPPPGTIGA